MHKKQILVVEDNEFNREMLKEILSDEYDVLEAENGKIGLEVLSPVSYTHLRAHET